MSAKVEERLKAEERARATLTKRDIPITKTVFGAEEFAAVQKPLETGWVVQGRYVKEFEDRFSAFTKAHHSIAASSCTTALHMAVATLELKPGDEVIVPAFTWVATANVVEYMGAKPVFCDVDLRTFNIDVNKIKSLITPRTVGIIPVHLFGLCAEMGELMQIANEYDLWVVEDAACAFGAWYRGRHAGTFGAMGCFSFHPRKSITTGEGGMITTDDVEFNRSTRSLRDHGATRSDLARHHNKASFLLAEYPHLGYNYRLTDIQGALGCAQMERAKWILAERTRRAQIYDEMLSAHEWIDTPLVPEGHTHGYQSYVCLFRPKELNLKSVPRLHEQRNMLMMSLEEKGIATRQGTHAVTLQGFYAGKYDIKPEDYPNAYIADRLSIALPLYPQMGDDDQAFVYENLVAELEG